MSTFNIQEIYKYTQYPTLHSFYSNYYTQFDILNVDKTDVGGQDFFDWVTAGAILDNTSSTKTSGSMLKTKEDIAAKQAEIAAKQLIIDNPASTAEAKQAAIDAVVSLTVELSDLSQALLEKEEQYNEIKANLNWNPPPLDADALSALQEIIADYDANMVSLQSDLQTITASSTEYDLWLQRMNIYKNFEVLLQEQLNQAQTFLESDSAIDAQEGIVTDLKAEIDSAVKEYTNIVQANNVQAMLVQSLYNSVSDRLTALTTISDNSSNIMNATKQLIAQKRQFTWQGVNNAISYNPVVFIPIKSQSYVTNNILLLKTIDAALITKYGFKQLGPDSIALTNYVRYMKVNGEERYVYDPPTGVTSPIHATFRIEVLNSSVNGVMLPYDSTTVFSVSVYDENNVELSAAGKKADMTTVLNSYTMSGTTAVTTSVIIHPKQRFKVFLKSFSDPKSFGSISINNSLVSMTITAGFPSYQPAIVAP